MNDDVSAAELLEREGWYEQAPPRKPRSRLSVIAVMAAVVVGCGLAAILVRVGADNQADDGPPIGIVQLPPKPTGGLAGGGVPSSETDEPATTRKRVTKTVTVGDEVPWGTREPSTSSSTSSARRSDESTTTTGVTTTDGNPPPGSGGGPTGSTPPNPTPTTTRTTSSCILIIICSG